jgi:hypothetical protein
LLYCWWLDIKFTLAKTTVNVNRVAVTPSGISGLLKQDDNFPTRHHIHKSGAPLQGQSITKNLKKPLKLRFIWLHYSVPLLSSSRCAASVMTRRSHSPRLGSDLTTSSISTVNLT